ncbi:hypothetical protein YC2023_064739 [Brassica napus]
MVEKDIKTNCARKAGSHTRNLLRVKRGLDMVRVLFQQIIAFNTSLSSTQPLRNHKNNTLVYTLK